MPENIEFAIESIDRGDRFDNMAYYSIKFPRLTSRLSMMLRDLMVAPELADIPSGYLPAPGGRIPILDSLVGGIEIGHAHIRDLTVETEEIPVFYPAGFGSGAVPGQFGARVPGSHTATVNLMVYFDDRANLGRGITPYFMDGDSRSLVFTRGGSVAHQHFAQEYQAEFPLDDNTNGMNPLEEYRDRQRRDLLAWQASQVLQRSELEPIESEEPVEELKGPPLKSPFDD